MLVTVITERFERSVAGTVFSDGKPRFIQIKGINIDAEIGNHMLYTVNEDVPGIIGLLGHTLGEGGVNIANFTLGREAVGGGSDRASLSGCTGTRTDTWPVACNRAFPAGEGFNIPG